MKNHKVLLSAFLMTVLISSSSLALSPKSNNWVWSKTSTTAETGIDVAIGEDGYLYVVGRVSGCAAMDDIYVAKVNPKTKSELWHTSIDYSCMMDTPSRIKVSGKSIYLCSRNFVAKVDTESGIVIWKLANLMISLHGMAIDPQDGSIWLTGDSNPTGAGAILLHIKDNGTDFSVIGSEQVRYQGMPAIGWDVAVTSDAVYVCGESNAYPWLWKRSKTSSAYSFSVLEGFYGSGLMNVSLGVNADSVYTIVTGTAAANTYLLQINKDSGLKSSGVYLGTIAAWTAPITPRITMHPTQQVPVVSMGDASTNVIVRGYTAKLSPTWSINPFAGWIHSINGIAFEAGLYGNMYVAGGVDGSMAMESIKVAQIEFTEPNGGQSKMVIAPNVIELEGFVKQAGISVKTGPNTSFSVEILDSNNNFLRRMEGYSGGDGYGNVSWNLKDRSGKLVAPGTYYAYTDAEGGMRAPVLVVIRRKK